MSKIAFNAIPEVKLPSGKEPLIVRGDGIEVEFTDDHLIVHSGSAELTLNSTTSPATLKVGDVVQNGPNKGWIYCKTQQGEAFLVAPKDSGVMQWHAAMDFAVREKAELPSKGQLDAMYNARETGAFQGTFNVTGSYPAGYYWSATQRNFNDARCQSFNKGDKIDGNKLVRSLVRCVQRYSVI